MKTLLCAAAAALAGVFGWLLESARCQGHHCVHHTPADDETPLPDLVELQGQRWMPCDTPACAHLETTHKRVHATELWACTGCGNTRTAPEGARRG